MDLPLFQFGNIPGNLVRVFCDFPHPDNVFLQLTDNLVALRDIGRIDFGFQLYHLISVIADSSLLNAEHNKQKADGDGD